MAKSMKANTRVVSVHKIMCQTIQRTCLYKPGLEPSIDSQVHILTVLYLLEYSRVENNRVLVSELKFLVKYQLAFMY